MKQQDVTFKNSDGHLLAGVLHVPDGRPLAWVLFAHCFTCGKNVKAAVHVTQALVDSGFGVLRFDFAGLGESGGRFEESTFSSNVNDILAAAEFLSRDYAAPAVLVGHSLGGAAVLRAAHRLPSVHAVATIGAPADPGHVRHLLGNAETQVRVHGEAEVVLAGRPFIIRREFLEDLDNDDWQKVIRGLRRPLLVFHSPLDEVVSVDNARLIFDAAVHPKSFVSLDDADHLLSRETDSRYVAAVIAAWASRYLAAGAERAGAWEKDEEAVVARIGRERFRTEVRCGRHTLIADEPTDVGGSDLGMSPYGLLSASLAACTAMTLRIYADRKKLDLERVTVRVRHDRVHEKDCEDCEKAGHRIDRLRREISMAGNLSDAHRLRLMEIADRCPVHKTLSGEIRIETATE